MPQYGKMNPAPVAKGWKVSKYDPDFPAIMVEWFEAQGKLAIESYTTDQGRRYNHAGHRPPSFARFASEVTHTCLKVLYDWRKTYPDFAEAFTHCKDILASLLVDGALMGAFDAPTTKLVLMNNHGFQEKATVEGNVKVVHGLSFSFIKPQELPTPSIQLEAKPNEMPALPEAQNQGEPVYSERKGAGVGLGNLSEVRVDSEPGPDNP